MQRLGIDLGERSYPILIGPGLIDDPAVVAEAIRAQDVLVVTNEVVGPLYLDRLLASLGGKRTASVVLPDGEQHKTLEVMGRVLDALVLGRMNRDACIAALGGGVVGDIAGFAAACSPAGSGSSSSTATPRSSCAPASTSRTSSSARARPASAFARRRSSTKSRSGRACSWRPAAARCSIRRRATGCAAAAASCIFERPWTSNSPEPGAARSARS
jgi:hypothetical protein